MTETSGTEKKPSTSILRRYIAALLYGLLFGAIAWLVFRDGFGMGEFFALTISFTVSSLSAAIGFHTGLIALDGVTFDLNF